MQTKALPPPYKGMRDDVPITSLENPYAQRLTNYNLDNGVPTLRNGDSIFYNGGTQSESLLLTTYGNGTNQILINLWWDQVTIPHRLVWDNVSSGAAVTVKTLNTVIGEQFPFATYFDNYLYFFGLGELSTLSTGMIYYNGTAWGTAAYTFTAGYTPYGGCAFKNRNYFVLKSTAGLHPDVALYGYSEIDSIAGPITSVDLGGIISNRSQLYGIRSISLSEGIEQENVLAFIFSNGEVLVYAGSYPDGQDWGIIGRFLIPKPIYYNAFVDVDGDSFVITESALVSLRDLFIKGNRLAIRQSISSSLIPNRWKQIMANCFPNSVPGLSLFVKGLYDSARGRITIYFPAYTNWDGSLDANSAQRLVFSLDSESWFEHKRGSASLPRAPAYFKSEAYYNDGGSIIKQEGAATFEDLGTAGIEYEMLTAPLPTNKFGSNEVLGAELLMKSDLYPQTSVKIVFDVGANLSGSQTLPDQGPNIVKPQYNTGGQGYSYAQVDVSGTTIMGKTIGQEVYALNLWYDGGEKGSR